MAISREDDRRIQAAVEYWFDSKAEQLARVAASGRGQGGTRDAVTGGGHLDGFNTLVMDELASFGIRGLEYGMNRRATLPGFYRTSKL